ncbi:fibroblast growth factor receptor 3-like isoform X1 [Acanthaster planci]|uniref:Fibroblast growth factor receptor 3-like isoform X1 n=1 Tax=Acanthaster planci TaxID=133434 RepID=A0A8B7YBD8_ACAPL|nr:fibroblast growth factor receptor 3-like isoform X1 [Acanthaster planci]XP_022089700.1 fibroblast growth factor receptor 3-like isoform X1 [Acanthaster planci]XP_022089701.1 fibroblast growth factor receptor 3-like isoform X1 [Acanthaster planci]
MTLPLKHRSDGPKFQHLSYTTLTLWVMTLYFLLVPTEQQPNAPGYLGCFVDCPGGQPCSGRALRTGIRDVDVEYIELCFRICLDGIGGRYKYAGLDFANKCFCGNNENFGRFGRRSDSECHDRCGANQDQICGDASRISVYQISQSVCNNDIGPPTNGAHTIIDPPALFYNLNNFKFFGTRVDFSCDVGYTLRGASSIECVDTGYNNVTWSDSVPTCEASVVDFTTQTQAESSRTNENTTKTVTERPSSKNVELSTAVPPAVSIRTRLSRWSKGSTTMVKSTVPETQENEKRDKPLDRVVFVVSLVAGFITGLVALAVIVVFVRWHKRQLVRNDSTRELCHQSESLAGDSRVSSTRAGEHLTDIPLTAMVTLTAKDYCPEHDKSVQVAYGNTGPDLSFSRDLVEIEGEIGRGTFGIVLLGTALGIEEVGKQSKVAIKTIKEGADRQAKMVLLEELDITKKIGSHPNIVRLLGYCIEADPIYIILEYLGKGDLKKVLMGFRNTNTNGRYANISGPSRSLSLRLLKFARDVADGMTFLASQKCIHRDLAARNVLVDDNMVCKVSDFGLARDVINIRVYRQGSKGPLPMRWMALESLLDDVYTIQSDVWSFGILMWEIVTLGARPYPHIMTAKDMVNQLSEGYRMSRPTNCNTQLYSIMRSCWHADPRLRPTFQEVLDKLEGLLTVEMGYVTIDDIDESIYDDTEIIPD